MENTLAQLKERWAHIVWGMDPYKGGDVPLLKIAEEDFEALEVHKEMTRMSHGLATIESGCAWAPSTRCIHSYIP